MGEPGVVQFPEEAIMASTTETIRPRAFSTYAHDQEEASTSTVIVGAGIIGCATAYYLSRSPTNVHPDGRRQQIHLVEASPELFASASGKSGGFVAEDWFGPATASLGELSFRLHQELANEHDGYKNWGYSRSTGTSLAVTDIGGKSENWMQTGGSRAQVAGTRVEHYTDGVNPAWLRKRKGDNIDMISEEGGVAQVDPLRLSQFLLRQSILQGVTLHHPAKAIRLSTDEDQKLSAIRIQHANGSEHRIPCTRLLIAAGAWTPKVFSTLFPTTDLSVPVSPYAGHSLVVRSPRWTKEAEAKGCHAVFTSMPNGWSPEIFSRVGEEIYIAGLNSSSMPLPELPTDAQLDPASVEELKTVTKQLVGDDMKVVREGLCFRPVTKSGNPILARVQDQALGENIATRGAGSGGVFLCAGHGPWGISQSLGTGKVMSEMLEGRDVDSRLSADIRRLGIR
ncbi:putative oxidoreductase C1F5.03c [Pseudocercospora fuligena]|uniref:Putative oxidoreductase C1F5.03c n=1 Tax=Pseudocercospora fuligena TaxID=685502 RepID=A0A8H6RA64_9PEZI|nr:putative oxidoreductase C1F5.03c [Pseudocercospora fuligena]